MKVGIYGTGRVAGSLARALSALPGVAVVGLAGRRPDRVAALARATGVPACSADEVTRAADLLLILVSDGAIGPVAAELAASADLPGGDDQAGLAARWVVHCAGSWGPEVLAPLTARGWEAATWHPLQAFPTAQSSPMIGATWTITSDDEPLAAYLEALTGQLHGRPHRLAAQHRAAYHAAAVMAANYPAALVAHAVAVLGDCGFPPDRAVQALLPLAHGALDALAEAGVPGGLTGPVMRGDVATITSHLRILDERPDTAALYRAAGLGIVPFAQAQGLPEEVAARLRAALTPSENLP